MVLQWMVPGKMQESALLYSAVVPARQESVTQRPIVTVRNFVGALRRDA